MLGDVWPPSLVAAIVSHPTATAAPACVCWTPFTWINILVRSTLLSLSLDLSRAPLRGMARACAFALPSHVARICSTLLALSLLRPKLTSTEVIFLSIMFFGGFLVFAGEFPRRVLVVRMRRLNH